MIISASRRTDIPAFYSSWFIERIKEGHVLVRSPVNKDRIKRIDLHPEAVDIIVFWTKNPERLMPGFEFLDSLGYHYYFLFTLTPYGRDLELNVPDKEKIIEIFIKLSQRIGKEKVIWRYDPIFMTDKIDIRYHCRWFDYLSGRLSGYTVRCIISFLDLYKKCERNLRNVNIRKTGEDDMKELTSHLLEIARKHRIDLQTCAEETGFLDKGVILGKCIDDELIARIMGKKVKREKDRLQRPNCRCVTSMDIGAYNTCLHHCLYCYANSSRVRAEENADRHQPTSPILCGHLSQKETASINNSCVESQRELFKLR